MLLEDILEFEDAVIYVLQEFRYSYIVFVLVEFSKLFEVDDV